MAKMAPFKRSKQKNNENLMTLDQFFVRKKPVPSDNHSSIKSKGADADNISSNNMQLQKETITTTKDKNGTNQPRQPLTELAASKNLAWNTKSTTRPQKPVKSSFVVLRDNNSQNHDTAEAQQQDHHNIDTLATTQSQFNTQVVPLVDTLDSSQWSLTSSPLALRDSQDSFFGHGGAEFRADSLNSDDSDDEYNCYYHTDSSAFFDDLEQVQVADPHDCQQPQPQWYSNYTSNKRTHQQSFDNDDENHCNKARKRAINRCASAPETYTSTNELSVFSPLSFSLDDTSINNYNSSDDEILSQSNTGQLTPVIQQQLQHPQRHPQQPTSSSSSSPLRLNTSLSDSSDILTTLPMSSSPLDPSLDVHVAYPVPRGTDIVDKFGQ